MKSQLAYAAPTLPPSRIAALRAEVDAFHAEYCAVLDAKEVERWPGFFTADATYRVTSRENALLDLPVGLVYCEGRDMIRDRALAIAHSQMFAPRHVLHVLGLTRILGEEDGEIRAQTPFLLLQTLVEGPSTIHLAGTYHDAFVRQADGRLLVARRDVLHDTEVLATSLAYPV